MFACSLAVMGASVVSGAATASPADSLELDLARGAEIYRNSCADCHGEKGQGVEGVYDSPLVGDLPVIELSKYVDKTMPEGAPEDCVGKEAESVSKYIHHAFYSTKARLRNNPPKIDFSRRTVKQYQNSVVDVLKQLRDTGRVDDRRGFTAIYYPTRKLWRGKPAIQRVDPEIDFDFADQAPDQKAFKKPEEFSILWSGGVIADQTGDYEFIVTSPNGFRLSINGENYTIDNQVNSTDQTEFKATVRLMGGQCYPITLSMFKYKDKSAAVRLEWIPPAGHREIIPEDHVSPNRFLPLLVLKTRFPADDSSIGYERGTSISRQWDTATTQAAIEAMNFVDQNLNRLFVQNSRKDRRKNSEQKIDKKQIEQLAEKFVSTALGRPLTDQEKLHFVTRQFNATEVPTTALKRVILLTLKSPQFLYLTFYQPAADSYHIAGRLATVLWDSVPDDDLRSKAANQQLKTRVEILGAAWKMLDNHRTAEKLTEFFEHWLEMEKAVDASKDTGMFPGFDQALVRSLRRSLQLSIEDAVWSQRSDFRQLLRFDHLYVDQRIADFYGITIPIEQDFERVRFEPDLRSGILTHPYLMMGMAHYRNTSPIHRGVFVAKSLLGRSLKPPPVEVDLLDETFDPTMTTRERVAHQTQSATCQSCHSVINPLGFSLENFDAVGRFRDTEKNKAVDSSATYLTPQAQVVQFQGARQLADYLANSDDAHRNFIRRLFEHFVKQPIGAFGPGVIDDLHQKFVDSDCNVRELVVEIAVVAAMHNLEPDQSNGKY